MPDAITQWLDKLLAAEPHLAQPVAYYRALAAVLATATPLAPLPPLAPGTHRARLAAGKPLLPGHKLPLDPDLSRATFEQVCQAVAPFQPGAEQAAQALDAGRLDLPALLASIISGDTAGLAGVAETAEVAPLTLRVLLEYTLRPTLRAWAASLLSGLDLADWKRATCPVCASPPVLAEWRPSARQRLLRCGICGTAWSFPLHRCVHCSSSDPNAASMISADDDDACFAQTCKACHFYIKTFKTETPIPHDLLALEDLATVYLDQGCQEKGYTRFNT